MLLFRFVISTVLVLTSSSLLCAEQGWVHLKGGEGPGAGKHIVLISGDEEYRSEETMPMLAQILSAHHGFDCTVLFSMAKDGTHVDPNNGGSLEGTQALQHADLMIIATRFRHPNEEAMQHIDDYVQSGKPIIGLRTATHAFNGIEGKYAHYSNGHPGEKWTGGFGRAILGEKWINHHGKHGVQATGGVIVEDQANHPILKGVDESTIFGPSDVYGVRLPLPGDSQPLVLGAVLEGMNPGDKPIEGEKNNPMMPVVWTKSYATDSGKTGKVVNTTMGASMDFIEPGLRRIVVNSVFWLLDLEVKPDLNIDFVTDYKPSRFRFINKDKDYWKNLNIKPSDFALEAVRE